MPAEEALTVESDVADLLALCGCEEWLPVLQKAKLKNVGFFIEVPYHDLQELLSANSIDIQLGDRVSIRRHLKGISPSAESWGAGTGLLPTPFPSMYSSKVAHSTGGSRSENPRKSTARLWSQSEGADLDRQDLVGPLVTEFASMITPGSRLCQNRVSAICYGV